MALPLPRSKATRGSALLFVVVILALLAIVGVAIVNRASSEGDASVGKRQYDKSLACADAARELLTSKFRLYGTNPTALTLATPVDDKVMATGHYDASGIAVTSVTTASGATANAFGVSDISNRIPSVNLGGQLYRFTVVCSSAGATRQSEVEFLVRFGL